jgi:hypothetical protein
MRLFLLFANPRCHRFSFHFLFAHHIFYINYSTSQHHTPHLQPVELRRKIARDRDPQRQWTRLSWQKQASSCVHLETFESFYHMTPDDFESLFLLLDTKDVDSRARKFVDLVLFFLHLS